MLGLPESRGRGCCGLTCSARGLEGVRETPECWGGATGPQRPVSNGQYGALGAGGRAGSGPRWPFLPLSRAGSQTDTLLLPGVTWPSPSASTPAPAAGPAREPSEPACYSQRKAKFRRNEKCSVQLHEFLVQLKTRAGQWPPQCFPHLCAQPAHREEGARAGSGQGTAPQRGRSTPGRGWGPPPHLSLRWGGFSVSGWVRR